MTFKEYIFELQKKKTRNFKHVCGQERKMSKEVQPVAGKNEIVVYQPEGGEFHIEVRVENETVWLTQAQMAELFSATKQNISLHIANIYKEGELQHNPTVKEYLTVQKEGKRNVSRKVSYYNLDVIISVGYRIKSIQGTRFRQWANQVLKDYMLKGYAINPRMLAHQSQQEMIKNVDTRLTAVEQRVDFFVNTVHSAQNQRIERLTNDMQKVMENFIDPTTYKHFLILDGQKLEADIAFAKIYGMAKKSILIIDNYVGIKTLDLLRGVAKNVQITIYSEQQGGERLTPNVIADFEKARPDIKPDVKVPNRKFHDRYVFLDFGTRNEKLFLCGASSKDSGNKITTIMQIECPEMYHPIVEDLKVAKHYNLVKSLDVAAMDSYKKNA